MINTNMDIACDRQTDGLLHICCLKAPFSAVLFTLCWRSFPFGLGTAMAVVCRALLSGASKGTALPGTGALPALFIPRDFVDVVCDAAEVPQGQRLLLNVLCSCGCWCLGQRTPR